MKDLIDFSQEHRIGPIGTILTKLSLMYYLIFLVTFLKNVYAEKFNCF